MLTSGLGVSQNEGVQAVRRVAEKRAFELCAQVADTATILAVTARDTDACRVIRYE